MERKITKKIRAADGTWRVMVSFDGVHWRLDKNAADEAARLHRVAKLMNNRVAVSRDPVTGDKKKRRVPLVDPQTGKRTTFERLQDKNLTELLRPSGEGVASPPVILPVTRIGGTQLPKKKGKNQKYRRNLKRKKERVVRVARLVHRHSCHGVHHPMVKGETYFICSCYEPKKHRNCGGDTCLYSTIEQLLRKKGKLS